MAMNTYALLNTALIEWLNRSGFTTLTDRTEDLIAMGQRRIHRTCDLNVMETVLATFSQSTETKATPTGYLRTKSMSIQDGNTNHAINGTAYKNVLSAGRSGRPAYYAVIGSNFHYGPIPDQSYSIDLVYYAALDILSTSNTTNWIATNVPELLLFAALYEAAIWLKDDVRKQEFGARFEEIKKELLDSEDRQDKEGGSLQVREQVDRFNDGTSLSY